MIDSTPNILVIMSDQHNKYVTGCYGYAIYFFQMKLQMSKTTLSQLEMGFDLKVD